MQPKRVEVTREGQAPTAKRKETASRETVEEHQSFEKNNARQMETSARKVDEQAYA